jgi:hypothetical protein
MTKPTSSTPMSRIEFLKSAAGLLAVAMIPGASMLPEGSATSHSAMHRRSSHRGGGGFPHPDPRPGINADRVLSAGEVGDRKAVLEAYAAARAYPEIFDGLFCACRCHDSHGHRSLLSCFESRQPTGCGGCLEEAELVARLAHDGRSLSEIRDAVDRAYAG